MSRRSVLLAFTSGLIFLGTLLVMVYGMLAYEPRHYMRSAPPADEEQRGELSRKCLGEICALYSAVSSERVWTGDFTDTELNCYFADAFVRSGLSEKLLPAGMSEPRVAFEQDFMRLSFRYQNTFVNTIVSIGIRVWLPKNETNTIAVQFLGFQAGLMPFSAQWLLERISETARQNAIEVTWYRHAGYPVALLRFQADQPRPTLTFKGIQFEKGSVTIVGHSTETRQP
jgi:hypothetical protein